MSTAPIHCAVADARTATELGNFGARMPVVTLALKRLLEKPALADAPRLLPSIAHVSDKKELGLADILMIGGGVLLDKYSNAEKVIKELAGKDATDGEAAGLDYDLHQAPVKWRSVLITFHMEVKATTDADRKEEAEHGLTMRDRVKQFAEMYGHAPEPSQYCVGIYAKNLEKAALSYPFDGGCDYRRSTPASGRRSTEDGASQKLTLSTGADVAAALKRKVTTLVLLHSDAPIDGAGFACDGYGARNGKTYWLTLKEAKAFEAKLKKMDKLSVSEATAIADWLEERLEELTNPPRLESLAAALMHTLDAFEARLIGKADAAEAVAEARKVAAAATAAKSPKAPKAPKGPKSPKGPNPPKVSPAGPSTALTPAKRPAEGEGEKLERLDTGNPLGPPCRKFQIGKCSGKCRFSHVTGAVEGTATEAATEDGA